MSIRLVSITNTGIIMMIPQDKDKPTSQIQNVSPTHDDSIANMQSSTRQSQFGMAGMNFAIVSIFDHVIYSPADPQW